MRLFKLKNKKEVKGVSRTICIPFFGNSLEIFTDLTTGKKSLSLVKYRVTSELIPNYDYPVHSRYKFEDGYELKAGDRVDLISRIDDIYWAVRKVGDNGKPYVISDEILKKVLLSFEGSF